MNDPGHRIQLPTVDAVTTKIKSCEEMEEHLTPCKKEINELLFKYLPDDATVRDVERLSCGLFFEIHKLWEQHLSSEVKESKE